MYGITTTLLLTDENHPRWRGDKATYGPIHKYVRKHNPQPDRCQECGLITTRLDLANTTGIYNRDFVNYRYLCRRCHSKSHEKDMSDYKCELCGSTKTWMRKMKTGRRPHWFLIDGKLACGRCLDKKRGKSNSVTGDQ